MRTTLLFVFKAITTLLASAYITSYFTQLIPPHKFWPLTFLALGFPLLAVCLLAFAIAWVFIKPKTSLVLLLIWLAGFMNIGSIFALNFNHKFKNEKDSNALRIISWNMKNFGNNARHAEHPDSTRRRMINFLIKQKADVLLLQEVAEFHNNASYSNLQVLADTLGYKYFYYSRDQKILRYYGLTEYGCGIFSKTPLLDTSKLIYTTLPVPESIMTAAIRFGNRKLRFFTTHLISMNLRRAVLTRDDEAYRKYDSAFIYGTSRFVKLKHYDSLHARQADDARRFINQHQEPAIVSGDFNAVSSSYTYRKMRGNLKDAFLEKGFGLGTSYTAISPTLRIDFIFIDPSITVHQFVCPAIELSDHYPLITDIKWR